MSEAQWLERCIAHMLKTGVPADVAKMEAEAWLESSPRDIEDEPEIVAGDIIEY